MRRKTALLVVVRGLLENGEEARFTVLATELGGAATPASPAAGGR
ncbi:MAG: hypothetical protein ACREK5_11030 [Gemmatimonadota bacterium]